MKKIVLSALSICLISSISFSVLAASPKTNSIKETGQKCVITVPAGYKQNPDPFVLTQPQQRIRPYGLNRASISVKVLVPCDAQWRSKYSTNWASEARTVITAGNPMLTAYYGITLSPTTASYTSTGENSDALLDDLRFVKFPNKTDCLVMGLSARNIDDPNIAGLTYLRTRYGMVFDNGRAFNSVVAQHEFGHMYTLDHCSTSLGSNYSPNSCVMKDNPKGLLNKICDGHDNEWWAEYDRY